MDKKLVALLSIFFLVFTLFIGSTLFENQFSRIIKATESTTPDPEKSLMLVYPLTVTADGQSKAKITVFVRNNKESGLMNKKVTLNSTLGDITPLSFISDKSGKTEFLISSNTPGNAIIEAIIDDSIKLSKNLIVYFE